MKARSIRSFIGALLTGAILIIIFTSAASAQEIPQPSVTPTPVPTPTPVVSPAPPLPPSDMPNLNENPPELPDIPPSPPLDVPDYSETMPPLPSAGRVGVDQSAQTPLTIEDAVRLALENNNDIEIAESDVKTAELNLTVARGDYIPQFAGESLYRRSTTPQASSLSGTDDGTLTETSFRTQLGISGRIPFQGGSFNTDFQSSRSSTNNTFSSLNPQYPTSFKFEYTQPILRGRKFDQTRRQIEVAKKNLALTDSQFRQRVIEIIAQVETAYWDLSYALKNLQVQLDGVRLANEQVLSNQRQVVQGVLAPSDVVAAKTQVSTFEQQVFLAEQAVTQAENNLKNLILADRNSSVWANPIVPVTPITLDPPPTELSVSLAVALNNRPEIQQNAVNREINQIDQRFFRDQTKPQIDLVGSYTSAGLAGQPLESTGVNPLTAGLSPLIARINTLSELNNLPPIEFPTTGGGGSIPSNLTGGYFRSLANLAQQKYPTYQVGIRFSLPLKNSVSEANLGKTLVEETRIESRREKTELQIETEVRNAIQALRSQTARLQSAIEGREAAEQLYESEQRKNLNGTSTTFLVLQRQTDLINARGREVQAQTDLNKAITQYQRSIGSTIDSAGISLTDEQRTKKRSSRTQITTVFGDR